MRTSCKAPRRCLQTASHFQCLDEVESACLSGRLLVLPVNQPSTDGKEPRICGPSSYSHGPLETHSNFEPLAPDQYLDQREQR